MSDKMSGNDKRADRDGSSGKRNTVPSWVPRKKKGRNWEDREDSYDEREGRSRRAHDDRDQYHDERDDFSDDGSAADLPRCPAAARCGGCEWLRMPYDMQLKRKQEYVEELFQTFRNVKVQKILGMENPYGYRNKIQLPFAPDPLGKQSAIWGIFERGSHHIVPCRTCLVEDPRGREIIGKVAKLIDRYGITPYNERTGEGLLRYCLVRTAHATGEVMLTFICNGDRFPSEQEFIEELLDECPEITTIVLNENTEQTSVILGDRDYVLSGPGYIEDELCGCVFRIGSSSFYQVNAIQAEVLYDKAIEFAQLQPGDRIGDAYCGTGTIGIVAAKSTGAKLLGVETNRAAVDDARVNAEINDIRNAEFIAGDAGSVFSRMARGGAGLDVVFMDPPRSGASEAFLANLVKLGPRRVVYISCDPKTQLRDVIWLCHRGYEMRKICPVDMFPHTDHVENIVLLVREPKPEEGKRSYSRSRQPKSSR